MVEKGLGGVSCRGQERRDTEKEAGKGKCIRKDDPRRERALFLGMNWVQPRREGPANAGWVLPLNSLSREMDRVEGDGQDGRVGARES